MNKRRILTFSLITSIGVLGMGAAVAQQLMASHGPGRHGIARICQGGAEAKLDKMTSVLTAKLDLTPDQRQNWDAVTQVVKDSDLKSLCPEFAQGNKTAPARLDLMEAAMSKGLTTVQNVRQPFNTFYTSLSESQQQELDTLLARRHRRSRNP